MNPGQAESYIGAARVGPPPEQQSTPYDSRISWLLDTTGHSSLSKSQLGELANLRLQQQGYLAAVADYAGLLAVLASVENVIKECERPGDVWTAKRLMVGLGPQVRAALAKGREGAP